MPNKLKTLMAVATLGLMLTPAMLMAAEDGTTGPDDQGQYSEEANPGAADQMEPSGDTPSGDESALPEDGQGSDEMAPQDSAPDEGAAAE